MDRIQILICAVMLLAAVPNEAARSAFERGEKALASGQLDEARSAYQQALGQTPGYAEALNGLGSVYYKQGRKAEAISQFKAAIAADPNFKLGYFNLGYTSRKTSEFATAASAYEKYTQLDPMDPDGYFGLGESYRGLGQSAKAISTYERYLSLEKRESEQKWVVKAQEYIDQLKGSKADSTTGTPVVNTVVKGDKAAKEGRVADAVADYESVLRSAPQDVEAHFKLANALARRGDYQGAIKHWERVTQLSQDAAITQSAAENIAKARAKLAAQAPNAGKSGTSRGARDAYEQGVRLVNAKDYKGALESLTEAIAAEPTLTVAYVARGSAHMGLRHFKEAVADYQKALELDSSRASPFYGLAESYRVLGRNKEAKYFYEKYVASSASDVRPALQDDARKKLAGLP